MLHLESTTPLSGMLTPRDLRRKYLVTRSVRSIEIALTLGQPHRLLQCPCGQACG